MRQFKKLAFFLAICLFMTGCEYNIQPTKSSDTVRIEGDGFESPEEAVAYYVNGLKKLDIQQMLGAYAWETQAENYRIDKEQETGYSLRSWTYNYPATNDTYISASAYGLYAAEERSIYNGIVRYIMADFEGVNDMVWFSDEKETDDFFQMFENGKYEDYLKIHNLHFVSPDEFMDGKYSEKEYQDKMAKMKECYGADDMVYMAAVADVDDKTFYFFPMVARYGKKWYIVSGWSPVSLYLSMKRQNGPFVITDVPPEDWR